ncbi:MAG: ribonuclease III [Candidatus Wallbacteria bacterium]|nr:ribonuclease III [Candidatus Wallbacteria bacterium]
MSGNISDLQDKISYRFRSPELLENALVHSSFANQNPGLESNERLEFLGDAVLELTVSSELYRRFPSSDEGQLSIMRSQLVSQKALSRIAQRIGLSDHLQLGQEFKNFESPQRRFLSSCLEALIGAVYLDSDYASAGNLILRIWQPMFQSLKQKQNYKNQLQQDLQQQGRPLPLYELVTIFGSPTAPVFEIRLILDGREVSRGKARNKKTAEQIAALRCLKKNLHLI